MRLQLNQLISLGLTRCARLLQRGIHDFQDGLSQLIRIHSFPQTEATMLCSEDPMRSDPVHFTNCN